MEVKRNGFVFISTLCVAAVADAGVKRFHTPARCAPGLPARDYQYKDFSPTIVAVSEVAIPLIPGLSLQEAAAGPGAAASVPTAIRLSKGIVAGGDQNLTVTSGGAGKLFQFIRPPVLQIGHCSLSRMAVTLDRTGRMVASFRADQNPRLAAGPVELVDTVVPEVPRETVLQTAQILRNAFVVRIRGYGTRVEANSAIGAPVVFAYDIPAFWVQRGVPRDVVWSPAYPMSGVEAARAYEAVDRVEIEFSYQLQSGLRTDIP